MATTHSLQWIISDLARSGARIILLGTPDRIMVHSWTPVDDFVQAKVQANRELAALASVWFEQRDRLMGQKAYRDFEERLKREWAIETGLIERIYVLEREITQLLIEHGL